MKSLRLILLGGVFALLLSSAYGQVNARRPMRRLPPQYSPNGAAATNAAARNLQTAPAPAPAPAPPVTTNLVPRVSTQAVVRIIRPPVDPEKARAAKAEALRKTVEFQKQRAEEGSESAQYELGLRYLKGDGVDKDEATGRRWLTLSSKNGYTAATRKLEDLDRPPEPPKTEEK